MLKIYLNKEQQEYPLYNKLKELNNNFHAMSEVIDQLIEITIFKFFKPRRIIELGAATGNWCVLMHTLSDKDYNQHYILVDNFSWCTTDYEYNKQLALSEGFPKNKKELEEHCSKHIKSFEIKDINIEQLIEKDLQEKVDLIRLDCDPVLSKDWSSLIEWIDRNGSDRLILISDDINSTSAPHRMLILQQLVAQNKMKLMCIGLDTAAWCRTQLSNEIQEWFKYVYSLKERSILNIDKKSLLLYGYKQDYLHIRKK